MIWTDHGALHWIPTKTKATGRRAQWRLRPSEFELDMVFRIGVDHQHAHVISHLKTRGGNYTPLEDKIWVFITFLSSLAGAFLKVESDFEVIEKSEGPFVLSISKACIEAVFMANDKTAIETRSEVITAQINDIDCLTAIVSVRKPNNRFSVEGNGVLLRVSPLIGASQQVVPVIFCPVPFISSISPYLPFSRAKVKCTALCGKSCTEATWAMTFILQFVTATYAHRVMEMK